MTGSLWHMPLTALMREKVVTMPNKAFPHSSSKRILDLSNELDDALESFLDECEAELEAMQAEGLDTQGAKRMLELAETALASWKSCHGLGELIDQLM